MNQIHSAIPAIRAPASAESTYRYDVPSIVLHWLMAALILLDWLIGQGRGFAPPGTAYDSVLSSHMILGIAIGAILVMRIIWRTLAGRHFGYALGPLGRAARVAHIGLYALMAATVLAGFANAMVTGTPIFGVLLPKPAPQAGLDLFAGLHSVFADLLGLLAAAHALAALGHHFLLRDRVLIRMAPFLPAWLRVD